MLWSVDSGRGLRFSGSLAAIRSHSAPPPLGLLATALSSPFGAQSVLPFLDPGCVRLIGHLLASPSLSQVLLGDGCPSVRQAAHEPAGPPPKTWRRLDS